MAATSTAETAPRYDCQFVNMLFSMSMPAGGVSKLGQKASRRLINSHTVLNTAPDTSATSHSFVLIVWASRSMLVRRPWYSPKLACDFSSISITIVCRSNMRATSHRTSLSLSVSSATWSALISTNLQNLLILSLELLSVRLQGSW